MKTNNLKNKLSMLTDYSNNVYLEDNLKSELENFITVINTHNI